MSNIYIYLFIYCPNIKFFTEFVCEIEIQKNNKKIDFHLIDIEIQNRVSFSKEHIRIFFFF